MESYRELFEPLYQSSGMLLSATVVSGIFSFDIFTLLTSPWDLTELGNFSSFGGDDHLFIYLRIKLRLIKPLTEITCPDWAACK